MSEEEERKLKYEQVKEILLQKEKEGLDLTGPLEERLVQEICEKVGCKKPTVFDARKRILAERIKQPTQPPIIQVQPTPKPPITPPQPKPEEKEKIETVPISEKLNMGDIIGQITRIIGLELDEQTKQQINELWQPNLSNIKVVVEEITISSKIYILITAILTAGIIFSAFLTKPKPKPKEPEKKEENIQR